MNLLPDYRIIPIIGLVLTLFSSCTKDKQGATTVKPKDTTQDPVVVVLEDTLAGFWKVDSATHNGTFDGSSTGLKIDFRKDGSYTLVNSSYTGTWEFIDNKTKIILDKNEPSYKTTWNLKTITSRKIETTFISPFTGGNAYWRLIPR